jgi:5-methylcytosine-specific restriction endonuclease McrA
MESPPRLCACGCGAPVRVARFPSQQPRYIAGHQHRGAHNGNYRGGKVKGACAVCGAPFERFPSQTKVTCAAPACYAAWQALTTRARGTRKVTVACTQCGAPIYLFPSQVDAKKNFCGRLCVAAWRRDRDWGPHNGNWRGGRPRYFRQQTGIRDGHRCVICGFHLAVDVHHITPIAAGGAHDCTNLLTLCPNHHRLAHLGLIDLEGHRRLDWEPGHPPTPAPARPAPASRSRSGTRSPSAPRPAP